MKRQYLTRQNWVDQLGISRWILCGWLYESRERSRQMAAWTVWRLGQLDMFSNPKSTVSLMYAQSYAVMQRMLL